jgi:hypothetical protein
MTLEMPKTVRGRPPKFGRPSRAVTLTLPEDVLERLTTIDADLGRAVVRLVEQIPRRTRTRPSADAVLARYGKHSVILVHPVPALRSLPGVQLVPLPSGQALISLRAGQSISAFELAIRDRLDALAPTSRDRHVLATVADILRQGRIAGQLRVEERTIIVLETRRIRGTRAAAPPA